MSRSVHHIPGRIRFKLPDLGASPTLASALRGGLEAIEGVEWVDIRASSCSIVVLYDPRRTRVDDLTAYMEGMSGVPRTSARPNLFDDVDAESVVVKTIRHAGVVFGHTAFKVALQQVVESSVSSAYRAALART